MGLRSMKVNSRLKFVNPPEGSKLPDSDASTLYEEIQTYGNRYKTTEGLRLD